MRTAMGRMQRMFAWATVALVGCSSTSNATGVDIPTGEVVHAAPPPATGSAPRRPRRPRESAVPPAPPRSATPEDRARADALFEQGRALMDAGKYQEACSAFAESEALAEGAGTVMNLGVCYEKLGDKERACQAFHTAGERVQDQPERRRVVEEHQTTLGCLF
jgi:hypothetical protein